MKIYGKVVALCLIAALSMSPALGGDAPGKTIRPNTGKIVETESSLKMPDPKYGYEGHLGCFVATKEQARCLIVVHQYPDTSKVGLGNTKMTYEGGIQLNNVTGYCFKTEFDGKNYPSKIFLSSEKVYFGGGITGYIAADYRDGTGWAWKLIPLRRLEVVNP